MAFADDFASTMAQYGITVDAASVPDRETLKAALEYVQTWLSGLDWAVREAFDEVTKDEVISHVLNDQSLNVAPAIPGLLTAFDQATGQPLSTLLQTALWCCENAEQPA